MIGGPDTRIAFGFAWPHRTILCKPHSHYQQRRDDDDGSQPGEYFSKSMRISVVLRRFWEKTRKQLWWMHVTVVDESLTRDT
jgi:hypothetical protein